VYSVCVCVSEQLDVSCYECHLERRAKLYARGESLVIVTTRPGPQSNAVDVSASSCCGVLLVV
jgi:hypothetical protein